MVPKMAKTIHSSARNNFIVANIVNSKAKMVTNMGPRLIPEATINARNPKLVDNWSRVLDHAPRGTVERGKNAGAHDFIDRAAGNDITRRKSEDTRGLLQ